MTRAALGVSSSFGDDSLGYFLERLDLAATRAAVVQAVRRAKSNKAFDDSAFIGLAIDGTTTARCGRPETFPLPASWVPLPRR